MDISLVIMAILLYGYMAKKRFITNRYTLITILFSIAFAWFAAFMAHQDSYFIWKRLSIIAFVQFPWRFLSLVILGFSFLAGSIVLLIKNKFAWLAICLLVIVLNWNYFLPMGGKMGALTDAQKFSGVAWDCSKQRNLRLFTTYSNRKSKSSTSNNC